MQFCLVSPNREAPGPQTWRLLSTDSRGTCTTEVVTLLADKTAYWSMHTQDRVSIEDSWVQLDLIQRSLIPHNVDGKEYQDLDDDLAEEGQLRDPLGDALSHAT